MSHINLNAYASNLMTSAMRRVKRFARSALRARVRTGEEAALAEEVHISRARRIARDEWLNAQDARSSDDAARSWESRLALVCDVQALQAGSSAVRGIGRYVAEHSRALVRAGVVRSLVLNPLMRAPSLRLDRSLVDPEVVIWNTATAIRNAAKEGPFAYHIMSPFELSLPSTVVSPHAVRPEYPLVVTLYDLVPLVLPRVYLDDAYTAARYYARLELLRAADLVLALSNQSKSDAVHLLDLDANRIVVIGGGASSDFRPARADEDPIASVRSAIPNVVRPFVLAIAGPDERKNIPRLLEAWAMLSSDTRSSMQLVLTGQVQPRVAARWRRHARSLGLREEDVVLTGWVPDGLLRALYQSTTLFVFPSLYEGFGLPVAEAAACECPIVTSDAQPIPEILDYAPSVFDGRDAASISERMDGAIRDEHIRNDLIEASRRAAPRHTWEAVALETTRALQMVEVGDWQVPRRRIALYGPIGEGKDGIAKDNRDLTMALSSHADVQVFATDRVDAREEACSAVASVPGDSLGVTHNPASYDAIIYSSGGPVPMSYPGVVLRHAGTRLIAVRGPGRLRRWLAEVLRRRFGDTAAAMVAPPALQMQNVAPQAIVASSDEVQHAFPSTARMLTSESFDEQARELVSLIDQLPPLELGSTKEFHSDSSL